jgi:hypothetical protein
LASPLSDLRDAKAFVVRRADVSAEDLLTWARTRMAGFKANNY